MEQWEIDLLRRVAELERQVGDLVKPEVPRWVDWTPTVSQPGALTVTVVSARYATYGQIAFVQARLTVTGSGTAGNAVSIGGQPTAIQPSDTGSRRVIGVMVITDTGTANYHGSLEPFGAADWRCLIDNAGFAGANPSFALANGDLIGFQAVFERV